MEQRENPRHGTAWRLCEREKELRILTDAIEAALHGTGGLVLIEGGPGIGRTRLLAEGRRLATAAGLQVLTARGTELERGFGLGLVRQLFGPVLAGASGGRRERLLAGSAAQAEAVLGPPRIGYDAAPDFAALHGLFWLTANLANERPAALFVDDLHWADTASQHYLAYLLPRLDELGILIVGAVQPTGPGPDSRVLNQLATDPACRVLRPAPLSRTAAEHLLRAALPGDPDGDFLGAGYAATAGNPLFLREFAAAVEAGSVTPSADNVHKVTALCVSAAARRIALVIDRLSSDALAVLRSVAVLDRHTSLDLLAALTGVAETEVATLAHELEQPGVLESVDQEASDGLSLGGTTLRFAHPLVRATVYAGIDSADRIAAHRRAAMLLDAGGARPEDAAAHLLAVPPGKNRDHAALLRRAAADAMRRGAPDAALTLLRRCRAEVTAEGVQQVLLDMCSAAHQVDAGAAAVYLDEARKGARNAVERGQISERLGYAYFFLGRREDAWEVWSKALHELPGDEEDLRRSIMSGALSSLLSATWTPPGAAELLSQARRLRPHPGPGAHKLDCVLSAYYCLRTEPEAVMFARHGLLDGVLLREPGSDGPLGCAWSALLAADDPDVYPSLDEAVEWANRRGETRDLAVARTMRSVGWLWRGRLASAAADAAEALRAIDVIGLVFFRPVAVYAAAEAAWHRGEPDQAEALLEPFGRMWSTPADLLAGVAWCRLLRLRGRPADALATLNLIGRRADAWGLSNPAVVAWRSASALCLHELGRDKDARTLADKEITLARRWGAPRALGRALRARAALERGQAALPYLEEAVDVLAASPCRLEHVECLIALGSAMTDAGRRADARARLANARELAEVCGASVLSEQARAGLRTAGARPRRSAATGPASLTEGELRVAELVAAGMSNRVIAEQLFISVKTVETHLSAVFRKLGVTRRGLVAGGLSAGGSGTEPFPAAQPSRGPDDDA